MIDKIILHIECLTLLGQAAERKGTNYDTPQLFLKMSSIDPSLTKLEYSAPLYGFVVEWSSRENIAEIVTCSVLKLSTIIMYIQVFRFFWK